MSIVSLKLTMLSVPNTIILGRKIAAAMAAHADRFPEPPVALSALNADLNDLEKRQQQATGGARSKDNILLRNEKLKDVQHSLGRLASYVQTVSAGDAAIIAEAGMDVRTRGPRKYETILPPEGVQLRSTSYPDKLRLRWKPVNNAAAYGIETCTGTVTPDKWKIAGFATSVFTEIGGLPSAELVSFRVFAIGAAGTSAYSEVVSRKMA